MGVVGVGAWAASTLLAGILPEGPSDVALFLLAAVAVGALLTAGFDRSTCGLRWAWPSAIGLTVAVGYAALAAPGILLAGTFTGLDLPRLLLLAPLSGISQELLFRSTVLPAVVSMTGGRLAIALPLQALLFSGWHVLPASTRRSVGSWRSWSRRSLAASPGGGRPTTTEPWSGSPPCMYCC